MLDIIPSVSVGPSADLEPGTLFLVCEEGQQFFALKTMAMSAGNRDTTLILGPVFPYDIKTPTFVNYDVTNALSFGKDFSIRLSSDARFWSPRRTDQTSVWLAVAEDRKIICADGGSMGRSFPCFVDLADGRAFEKAIGVPALYTKSWEIVTELGDGSMHQIVKFEAVTTV